MLGNEGFIFCTIAVGDEPVYQRVAERPWYAELSPDKITDAWYSVDLLQFFNNAPEKGNPPTKRYFAQTADNARTCMDRAEFIKGRYIPMVRGNGHDLLRTVARRLIDEEIEGKTVNAAHDDAAIAEKIREIFAGFAVEVKIAQPSFPLDINPKSDPPSAWVKNPLLNKKTGEENRRAEHPSPPLT
ncbi:hypothetical protein AB8O64_35650 (plasmid) [Streptomyces sp. QH1-20]|uniref:hypothetical protein n=1 Tax=Streptomyces sp. QH1-20 TaxID=3240934 RepID=UPI0035168DEA